MECDAQLKVATDIDNSQHRIKRTILDQGDDDMSSDRPRPPKLECRRRGEAWKGMVAECRGDSRGVVG